MQNWCHKICRPNTLRVVIPFVFLSFLVEEEICCWLLGPTAHLGEPRYNWAGREKAERAIYDGPSYLRHMSKYGPFSHFHLLQQSFSNSQTDQSEHLTS